MQRTQLWLYLEALLKLPAGLFFFFPMLPRVTLSLGAAAEFRAGPELCNLPELGKKCCFFQLWWLFAGARGVPPAFLPCARVVMQRILGVSCSSSACPSLKRHSRAGAALGGLLGALVPKPVLAEPP